MSKRAQLELEVAYWRGLYWQAASQVDRLTTALTTAPPAPPAVELVREVMAGAQRLFNPPAPPPAPPEDLYRWASDQALAASSTTEAVAPAVEDIFPDQWGDLAEIEDDPYTYRNGNGS